MAIPESDHSTKTVQAKGAAVSHSSGGKIPFVLFNSLPLTSSTRLSDDKVVTPSMFGHLQEDGMRSQRIGRRIR